MKHICLMLGLAICYSMLFLVAVEVNGQDMKISGTFQSRTIRVGDEIFFSLSARHPKDMQILFPDSAYDYAPFEFKKKRFFITETRDGISRDSAVYHLTTFETDSIQRLRLPVYVVNPLDCTRHLTSWDTVRLQLLVTVLPEQIGPDLPVRATIAYQDVPKNWNVPLIIVVFSMTLLLSAVLWVVFGGRVRQYLTTRKMKQAHLSFINQYTAHIDQIRDRFSKEKAEQAITLWKQYMEKLERKPYTKLTTLETKRIVRDEHLVRNLRVIDAAIYGSATQVVEPLTDLRVIADRHFNEKLKEVSNG